MKIKKGFIIGITVFLLIIMAFFAASQYQKDRARSELAERIFSQGSGAFQGSTSLQENDALPENAPLSDLSLKGSGSYPENIAKLKASIAAYEKRIERHVKDAAATANYWKILAVRLQDRGLHGDALDALEHAIFYSPADPALHYYTGLSAGIIAKSIHLYPGSTDNGREQYYALAEDSFLRAIELDGRYLRPRYSLGVLYVFELERPEDAIPHLERCLEISRNDVDTMFVLARAHYMLKNFRAALDIYDRIITLTRDEQKRIDAQNNRQLIMGQMYG